MSVVLPENILRCLDPAERAKLGTGNMTAAEASAKADTRSEKLLQQQIAQYLRLLDVWFDCDSMAHRRRGTPGAPDFIFAYRGRPVAIEAKTATGRLSAEQQQAHIAMSRNGWTILVARSLADVQGLLRAIDAEGKP